MVALALALLAAGQGAALLRTPGLPDAVRVEALVNGYSYGTDGERATVGFQLANRGEEPVRVLAAGRDGPGLELVDVVAAGAPVGFRAAGAGSELLPAFDLQPGLVVELSLVYRVTDCGRVPSAPFPVTLRLAAARARGVVEVPLPRYPDDAPDAGPDDEVEWQTVLVRDLCTTG